MKTSASTIVLNDDSSQVLLILREDFRVWTIPGGGPEANESLEETALRETYEETGVHVDIEAKLGEYYRPNMPSGANITHAFIARYKSGSLEDAGWESADVQWFDINNLPKRLMPMSGELIEDALVYSDQAYSGQPFKKTQYLPFHIAFILKGAIKIRNLRNLILGRT